MAMFFGRQNRYASISSYKGLACAGCLGFRNSKLVPRFWPVMARPWHTRCSFLPIRMS